MHNHRQEHALRPALRTLAVLITCSLLALGAAAKDWTQWCGSDGKNMAADETGIPQSFKPGEKGDHEIVLATAHNVKWGVYTGSYGVSSPTVVGDKVLVGNCDGGQGMLHCLDANTGKILWQWIENKRPVSKMINGRPFPYEHWQTTLGLCSTATVEDGRVYFVSQRGDVLCLDLAGDPAKIAAVARDTTATRQLRIKPVNTAKVIWRYDMYEKLAVRPANIFNGSVLIDGDYLYVPTSNGVDRVPDVKVKDELRRAPTPNAPSLIVLDKKTGRLVAQDELKIAAGPRMLHGQYSSCSKGVVNGRTLIFFAGGDGIMYAFEALTQMPEKPATLKLAWQFDCVPTEYQEQHKKEGLDLIAQYCLGDKRRADSTNKKSDGTWVGFCEIIATPVFYQGKIYVAIGRDPAHGRGRGALWCIDPAGHGDITQTGKVWCYQGLDRTISNVSIADGLLYISDMCGRLHCLEAATGKLNWVYETKGEVWGSTLAVDGKVFLPTHKALYVFKAGREAKLLSQINLGAPNYVPPVAVNSTLYIASRNYLWAVHK